MLDLHEMIKALDEAIEKAKAANDRSLVKQLQFEKQSYEYSLNCGNGRFTGFYYPNH